MLKDNPLISFNPSINSYDFSACSELEIVEWIELQNLQLDYPIINYEAKTIEESLVADPVVLPATESKSASKLPIVAIAIVGGLAVTTVAVLAARSRLKSKMLGAFL